MEFLIISSKYSWEKGSKEISKYEINESRGKPFKTGTLAKGSWAQQFVEFGWLFYLTLGNLIKLK